MHSNQYELLVLMSDEARDGKLPDELVSLVDGLIHNARMCSASFGSVQDLALALEIFILRREVVELRKQVLSDTPAGIDWKNVPEGTAVYFQKDGEVHEGKFHGIPGGPWGKTRLTVEFDNRTMTVPYVDASLSPGTFQ